MRSIAALVIFLFPLVAVAQPAPTLLEEFNAWEAYRHNGSDGVSCFVLSRPTKVSPDSLNHGDVYFFLTSRPAEGIVNEPSLIVGYPFADDSKVTVDVDGKEFTLFTKDDGAYMEQKAEEAQLVAAMRAGSNMTVRGTSQRGNSTSYTFSLSGVTAGSNRISSGCDA